MPPASPGARSSLPERACDLSDAGSGTPGAPLGPAGRHSPALWVRRCGARHKLLAAFALAFAVASLSSLALSALSLGGATVLALAARLPRRTAVSALLRVNVFFLFLLCVMPLAFGDIAPKDAIFSLGPVHWTPAGFTAAFRAALKGNAILFLFLALPGTSPFVLNCKALLDLGLPEKLVTLLQLVARHAVTLRRELNALFTAAALRGFTPRCNPRTYRTTAYLAGMLLVRALDRSRRIEKAMLLRGFTGKLPLLLPPEQGISAWSLPLLLVHCGVAVALPLADYFVPWSL